MTIEEIRKRRDKEKKRGVLAIEEIGRRRGGVLARKVVGETGE